MFAYVLLLQYDGLKCKDDSACSRHKVPKKWRGEDTILSNTYTMSTVSVKLHARYHLASLNSPPSCIF
jgi:hypothetical protein